MIDFTSYVKSIFAERGATMSPWQKKMADAFARGETYIRIPHIRGAGRFFDALSGEYAKWSDTK